jgi:hypothetical protein
MHVAAGFMPAFKYRPKNSLIVVERGHKACRYVSALTKLAGGTYIVHMKHVSASEARKNWFKLLDEAANGEVIAIQRNDKKLILKMQKKKPSVPSYKGLIRFPDADNADIWGWEWEKPGQLAPRMLRKSGR